MHQYMLHICNHFQHLINSSTEQVKSRSSSIKEKRYNVYDPPETTANYGRGHEYVEYMEFFSKPTLIFFCWGFPSLLGKTKDTNCRVVKTKPK